MTDKDVLKCVSVVHTLAPQVVPLSPGMFLSENCFTPTKLEIYKERITATKPDDFTEM